MLEELPKRLAKDCVFCETVSIDRKQNFNFVLTNQWTVFEVQEHGIVKSLKITGRRLLDSGSVFNLSVFRRRKCLILLLLVDQALYVIERADALSLLEIVENVESVSIEDVNGAKVKITTRDSGEPILTDFLARISNTSADSIRPASFDTIMSTFRATTAKCKADVRSHQLELKAVYDVVTRRLRQLPNSLRTECQEERVALVRYGDIFVRVHNGFVVLGVPVLNCSSTRQLTVLNIRPSLHCDQMANLSYSHQLYRLRNDSYTFEKLYELFDNEDEEEFQFDNIGHEWTTSGEGALKAEQTGVVVLKVEQMDLIEHSRYQLEVCIDYHIDLATSKSEHQLFAGKVILDAGVLASDQFRPSFLTDQGDFFKDLLAIKFVTNFLALLISFSQAPTSKLTDFIEHTLRFRRISSGSSTQFDNLVEHPPIFQHYADNFYQSDGFMAGTMIRLDDSESPNVKLKIYGRDEQIITFVRRVYQQYPENCEILPFGRATEATSDVELLRLKSAILDEIKAIEIYSKDLDGAANFRNQLSKLEFRSDVISGSGFKYKI